MNKNPYYFAKNQNIVNSECMLLTISMIIHMNKEVLTTLLVKPSGEIPSPTISSTRFISDMSDARFK